MKSEKIAVSISRKTYYPSESEYEKELQLELAFRKRVFAQRSTTKSLKESHLKRYWMMENIKDFVLAIHQSGYTIAEIKNHVEQYPKTKAK